MNMYYKIIYKIMYSMENIVIRSLILKNSKSIGKRLFLL